METMDMNEGTLGRTRRAPGGRPWIIAAIVVVVVLAGAAGAYYLFNSEESDAPAVVDDEGDVLVPQVPSLRLFDDGGTWYVENDGNVTMSDIEVSDAAGTAVCTLGTLSPGDRAACDGAGSGEGLTASGSGPQGQPVEVGPEISSGSGG